MYPTNQDNIVAYARGPVGPAGPISQSDIDALLGGVVAGGNTLAKLYALILLRATLDGAALTNATTTTQAPGNASTKLANAAFVHQEVTNASAALQSYIDSAIQGISNKYSARCATAAGLPAYTYANGTSGVGATITANANGALAMDGQSPPAGVYVLVKNETAGAAPCNGLYQVTQAGDGSHPFILTRAQDDDTSAEMAGAFVFVELGTVNAASGWGCWLTTIVVGTTAITWTQFSGAGSYSAGTGLSLTGSQFAIADAELLAIAGLASAADRLPYFTGSGTAALATLTAFVRTLLAAVDVAAFKTTLALVKADVGLGSVANVDTSNAANISSGTLPAARLPATATSEVSPSAPTGTTDASGKMMGLGASCSFTPTKSTRAFVQFVGAALNVADGAYGLVSMRFGTGSAPANNAAITGTQVGTPKHATSGAAGGFCPFTVGGVITGLTLGTAYWFDIVLASSSGTENVQDIDFSAFDI